MKKLLSLLLSAVIISASVTAVSAADKTRYVFNGNEANISSDAIFKDGKIFVPAAEVFKLTKVKVIEKSSNNSITIEALGKPGYVSSWINTKKVILNGQSGSISAAPFKQNGVTYVPSDFVEEQIGVKISYDSSKKSIYIDSVKEGKITSTAKAANAPASTAKTSTGEKMVTKSQLEAAGKGPDSVNWRYQEDYLANKPIPESALIYKPKTAPKPKTSTNSSNQAILGKEGLFDSAMSPLTDLYDSIFGAGAADEYIYGK